MRGEGITRELTVNKWEIIAYEEWVKDAISND